MKRKTLGFICNLLSEEIERVESNLANGIGSEEYLKDELKRLKEAFREAKRDYFDWKK